MAKITVYFTNGCRAQFDAGNANFEKRDGKRFKFSPSYHNDPTTYEKIIDRDQALINWDNVCFVQRAPEEKGDY